MVVELNSSRKDRRDPVTVRYIENANVICSSTCIRYEILLRPFAARRSEITRRTLTPIRDFVAVAEVFFVKLNSTTFLV